MDLSESAGCLQLIQLINSGLLATSDICHL